MRRIALFSAALVALATAPVFAQHGPLPAAPASPQYAPAYNGGAAVGGGYGVYSAYEPNCAAPAFVDSGCDTCGDGVIYEDACCEPCKKPCLLKQMMSKTWEMEQRKNAWLKRRVWSPSMARMRSMKDGLFGCFKKDSCTECDACTTCGEVEYIEPGCAAPVYGSPYAVPTTPVAPLGPVGGPAIIPAQKPCGCK